MDERYITPAVLQILQSMPLFKGKDSDELTEWLGRAPFEGGTECEIRLFGKDERITVQGSFGNSFYVLLQGSVDIGLTSEVRPLATLVPGQFFGEMTLLSGLPSTVTAIARDECATIEVPRRAAELWMRKPGPFRDTMDQVYMERGLADQLLTIPGFSDIDPTGLREVARKARLRIFGKDEVIVREGEAGDSLFLIRDGYVRVEKSMAAGPPRTVAYLNGGAYFGESALLRGERRSATVVAMGKVEVVQVMREGFSALMNRNERLADRLVQIDQEQQIADQGSPGNTTRLGFVGELVEKGVVKATSALVIHLDSCTRCGNCVKACAELHGGISRLTRHGMLFEEPERGPQLVATSCMHCLDPECMIGCPTGAITRDVNGEVLIEDSCIGCGNCARRCPYGNISMADALADAEVEKQRTGAPTIGSYLKFWRAESEQAAPNGQKAVVRRIAVKCDLCRDYNYNHGCVHNCPYGAIERIDASSFIHQLRGDQ